MYITEWKEEADKSFFECIASIREGMSPIFKVRAVKMCDGNYMSVVRDYKTNQMLNHCFKRVNEGWDIEFAKNKALELSYMVLITEGMNECIILNKWVCPYKEISGKHCSYCKIPDFYLSE